MNNNIKIALALITGGTIVYLSRKIKNRKSKSATFTAPDGKVYKNGKKLHFKTPEINEITPKTNFKYEATPQNYDAQPKNVEYHQKGIRHH